MARGGTTNLTYLLKHILCQKQNINDYNYLNIQSKENVTEQYHNKRDAWYCSVTPPANTTAKAWDGKTANPGLG